MIQQKISYKKKILIAIVLFINTFQIFSQDGFKIPEKPSVETSVYDKANIFSPSQKHHLEQKLIQYSDSTSTQIVIATVTTINNDDISLVGANWAHKWGIGQEKEDNGIFILLALNDRKVDIATGYGIEYILTDLLAERIINNVMIPEFKKGDYFTGLNKGTDTIFSILNGEYKGGPKESDEGFDPGFIVFIIILIIFFIIISRGNRGNKGGRRNYRRTDSRDILETIILSNAGRGGFGSGGFGGGFGGSSGGFGGGGFGGGGASGSW